MLTIRLLKTAIRNSFQISTCAPPLGHRRTIAADDAQYVENSNHYVLKPLLKMKSSPSSSSSSPCTRRSVASRRSAWPANSVQMSFWYVTCRRRVEGRSACYHCTCAHTLYDTCGKAWRTNAAAWWGTAVENYRNLPSEHINVCLSISFETLADKRWHFSCPRTRVIRRRLQ